MTTPLCQAPFKSLRFGQTGRVFVCCHNQQDQIGIYPRQPLYGIWEDHLISGLRRTLGSGVFAKGCSHCKKEAESSPIAGSRALYDRFNAVSKQPVILDFKTDHACNLSCIMCSGLSSTSIAGQQARPDSPFHSDDFIEELKNWIPELSEVRFSGGEPFLSAFYRRIWKLLTELNPECRIVVQTNGTILDDSIKALMSRGNFHINLSIDSFRKETYSKIRCGSTLELVLQNAAWFRNYCLERGRFWGMTSCAMQENKDEFAEIVSQWNAFEARGWFSLVYLPPVHALWTLSEIELELILASMEKIQLPAQNELQTQNRSTFELLRKQIPALKVLSAVHHKPKIEHLIPAGSLADRFQDEALAVAIRKSFPKEDDRPFNIESLEMALSLSSEAMLAEMVEILDQQEVSALFSAFLYSEEAPR